MSLRKLDKISQKYKDVVFGYIKQVQLLLPDDTPYYNIVSLIQNLILFYFYPTLDSKILDDREQETFRNLWIANNKLFIDNEWKLLYRMTASKMDNDDFFEKVHGRSNIILLVESENGNVFGGYTKTGWIEDPNVYGHSEDRDAFIFQIRSSKQYKPYILNISSVYY